MTRAQSHTSTGGRAGKHSQEERARKLEVRLVEGVGSRRQKYIAVYDKVVVYAGQTCRS